MIGTTAILVWLVATIIGDLIGAALGRWFDRIF